MFKSINLFFVEIPHLVNLTRENKAVDHQLQRVQTSGGEDYIAIQKCLIFISILLYFFTPFDNF